MMGREEVSTDCHKIYRPDLPIAADAASVRSLAVSPWSAPGSALACFPWARGGGVRRGGVGDGVALSVATSGEVIAVDGLALWR
ncbi:MAG: hypothetical protein GY832_44230 [Chloroflexi bacterium]|nr:hypothetical protein [Chloroflexota bacterium]